MQTRIIASLAGIALGLLSGTYLGPGWGISGTTNYIVFGVSGLLLGNVVSLLIDVFSGNTGASTPGA
jgi:hypothetical protein